MDEEPTTRQVQSACEIMSRKIISYDDALAEAGFGLKGGWEPIETAPKDGTPILLYDPNGRGFDLDYGDELHVPIHTAVWQSWPGIPDTGNWQGYYSGLEPVKNPTHWMPLPSPPTSPPDTPQP